MKKEHGFHHIEKAALQIRENISPEETKRLAFSLFENPAYQVRMLAVFLMGYLSVKNDQVLSFLRDVVSGDVNWRVQEILAKAFDYYCGELGYEKSLPVIKEWLSQASPAVKRAVIEGLRVWTDRDYFATQPEVAIELISSQRKYPGKYLSKSVANSLRDIRKWFPDLVNDEIKSWDQEDPGIKFIVKLIKK